MAPKDAFSDSDDEETTETQTSVLLGLPDGTIANPLDLADPAVSRMGGIPVPIILCLAMSQPVEIYHRHFKAFPRRVAPPPIALAQCKVCNSIMELLVQLWCPFEASPYDRVLYVWGCSRMPCQKKEGRSVQSPSFTF